MAGLFGKKAEKADLGALEELLISADIAADLAAELVGFVRRARAEEARERLRERIEEILKPCEARIDLGAARPYSIVFLGVNGAGKTTTIGKLAHAWRAEGRRVGIVACDTFRASAVEQLGEWASAAGARFVSKPGSDPSGLAFDGMKGATLAGDDAVMFDTAGRLANNDQLLAEAAKIIRTIGKAREGAPTLSLLVLDGSGGQNSLAQYERFSAGARVDGVVATKLDGTAKAGFLLTLAQRHRAPIYYIGEGEGAGDLRPFSARAFAEALVG